MVGTNCYVVYNENIKECFVVDPAAPSAPLVEFIQTEGLQLQGILLTHGHFDHIMGLSDVMEDVKVPVYVEEADLPMMTDGESNLSSTYVRGGYRFEEAVPVSDGQQLEIAGFQFRVIHTPGHTAGGTCYYIESDKTLMSGDTLFAGSVGRTDYPTASSAAMMESLHDKLCKLPDDTDVYPGHGEFTTIGYEKQNNPFM